jgi:hypothetical protein
VCTKRAKTTLSTQKNPHVMLKTTTLMRVKVLKFPAELKRNF